MLCMLIIGAKLQGVEAMYLAGKAGYHTIVVDRNLTAPGTDLADEFYNYDIFEEEKMLSLFGKADVVLPVIENSEVLKKVKEYGEKSNTKVLFDLESYDISSSKEKSNTLFLDNSIPIPGKYPDCSLPVILKPDGESGSSDVKKAFSHQEVSDYLEMHKNSNTIIQEYLQGRSYSLEVIGNGEEYFLPEITEVVVDGEYDCKRIISPAQITEDERMQMFDIGKRLAEVIKVKGIFDIEVISSNGKLKVLEIDSRLPSQTPISVYHSSGNNMVEIMTNLILGNSEDIKINKSEKVCFYQQIWVCDGMIQVMGEHIMGSCSHLKIIKDFFGCKEAITDYTSESKEWKAIIMVVGNSEEEANKKFYSFINNMKKATGINDWLLIEA